MCSVGVILYLRFFLVYFLLLGLSLVPFNRVVVICKTTGPRPIPVYFIALEVQHSIPMIGKFKMEYSIALNDFRTD